MRISASDRHKVVLDRNHATIDNYGLISRYLKYAFVRGKSGGELLYNEKVLSDSSMRFEGFFFGTSGDLWRVVSTHWITYLKIPMKYKKGLRARYVNLCGRKYE